MDNLVLFLIVEIILAFLMILEQYNYKYKKSYLIVGAIVLIVLISIRKNTPDLDIYETLYYYPESYKVEKGYIFLQNIFKRLNLDFVFLKVGIAILTVILLYRGFYKLVKYPNGAMFIYMSYSFFEKPYIQIRNALCIAIFMNILPLIIDNKKIKSSLGILLSTFFHITGYFYFAILGLSFFNITKEKIKKICYITLILSIILYFIDISSILLKVSSFNLGRISERIKIYFLSEEGKRFIVSSKLGIRSLFSPLLYIFYCIKINYLDKYFYNNFLKEKYIFYLFSFSILFRLLSYEIIIFNRIVGTFDFSETLALAMMLEIKNKYLKILYIFLIIIYVFLSSYITGKNLILW